MSRRPLESCAVGRSLRRVHPHDGVRGARFRRHRDGAGAPCSGTTRQHTTNCACTSRVCRPREDDARCDSPRLEFDQVVLRFAIASRSRRPRRPRGPRAEERFCGPTTIPYFRLWASRLCVLFVWCPCRRGHSTPGARTPSQRSGRRPTLLDGGFFLREAKIPSHHSAEGRASSAHYVQHLADERDLSHRQEFSLLRWRRSPCPSATLSTSRWGG